MKKTITEETKAKMKKAKEESQRKIGDFLDYEIWVDSRNFTTIDKEGTQHYYSSLYQLFYGINLEINQRKIRKVELDNVVKLLQDNEYGFLAKLKETLGELTFIEPNKCIN